MELNLKTLLRRYWRLLLDGRSNVFGPVMLRTVKQYSTYAHAIVLLTEEETTEHGHTLRLHRHIGFHTYNESPVIRVEPIGENLYRSTDAMYIPYNAQALGRYLERKGLLSYVGTEQYALPVPPEDSAIIFVRYSNDVVREALLIGHAYLANWLYPAKYAELLPNAVPVSLHARYERGKGTELRIYDHPRSKDAYSYKHWRSFPGVQWATDAKSWTEALYYINRALGKNLPFRNVDKYFTALVSEAYQRMAV